MAFDIDQVVDDMVAAVAGEVKEGWADVQQCVRDAFQREKQALADIAQARIAGAIDDDEAKSQIDDEKDVLEAELLVCQIKAKVSAQQAVNAAIKVLNNAIGEALGVVLR